MSQAHVPARNPSPERLELEPFPLSCALLDAARHEDVPRLARLAGQLHHVEPAGLNGDAVRYLPAPDRAWLLEHAERVWLPYGPYDWTSASVVTRFSG